MIKVVLLGDSIRQVGYGPLVPKLLGDNYNVYQPNDNCRFVKYTLRLIFDEQNNIKDADIIHFNCGLWDCTHLFDDGLFTDYDEYEKNMIRLGKLLLRITPHVIFATTTPVRKENIYDSNEEIKSFNDRIVPKLEELGIKINDFYTPLSKDINRYVKKEDLIHPTEEASLLMAKMIVSKIHDEEKLILPNERRNPNFIRDLDIGRPIDTNK